MKHTFYIITNNSTESLSTKNILVEKMKTRDIAATDKYDSGVDLIVCIGGDGVLLDLVHAIGVPKTPIVGINTGHLGFFQDILPDQIDDFLNNYSHGKCHIQELSTVEASVWADENTEYYINGINEIVVKGNTGSVVHLNISIGDSFIEKFTGDGIIVSTPAGSTAYNYSLGGGIVDPRLELLQLTPIAPMNSTAYRSFTSPLILPSNLSLEIVPDKLRSSQIHIESDGFVYEFETVERILIKFSDKRLKNLKLFDYDFWKKVKEKFL